MKSMGSDYSILSETWKSGLLALLDLFGRYKHWQLSPSLVYKFFSWIAVKANMDLKIEQPLNDLSDFSTFKDHWYEYLGFLQEHISKEFSESLSKPNTH